MQARFTSSVGRRRVLAACGALGLALIVPAVVHALPGRPSASVTFARSVALPGVILTPGSYTFEVMQKPTDANIVRVSNPQGSHAYFTGLTMKVTRPTGASTQSAFSLGESANGEPRPILVWFPADASDGYAFIYR